MKAVTEKYCISYDQLQKLKRKLINSYDLDLPKMSNLLV